MRKIICCALVLVLILGAVSSLSGCGADKQAVKEALIGKWGYYVYASVSGEDCYQIYQFDNDGTAASAWINADSSSKSTHNIGNYTIKDNVIEIRYSDGTKSSYIEYTFENGVLRLFDKGSDGSKSQELKKM